MTIPPSFFVVKGINFSTEEDDLDGVFFFAVEYLASFPCEFKNGIEVFGWVEGADFFVSLDFFCFPFVDNLWVAVGRGNQSIVVIFEFGLDNH